MAYEKIIKRILWTVKCTCKEEYSRQWENNPPREVQCPHCKTWLTPEKQTYEGKDKFDEKA
jgi:hypothetical protein